jgi:hypothetical protein
VTRERPLPGDHEDPAAVGEIVRAVSEAEKSFGLEQQLLGAFFPHLLDQRRLGGDHAFVVGPPLRLGVRLDLVALRLQAGPL